MKKHLFLLLLTLASAFNASGVVVSRVNTELNGSQKYYLEVDGKPFYMASIQVRMDLMRHSEGWSSEQMESLMAQLSRDGFNAVNIPLHWYEVEPSKDNFDWTILDEYLGLADKYGLRMEILWFGTNSGGHVQWLSRSTVAPVHLRVPDYILYAPSYGDSSGKGFQDTTSDFTIKREMSNYTLDLEDDNLCERETYVLSKVMKHISLWDKHHGGKHIVIGFQIGNEVLGLHHPFSNKAVMSYLSRVAGAVKSSDYVVWTRVNCVFWNKCSRILCNEAMKLSEESSNIDFVGVDTYSHHFPSDESFIASMRDNMPYLGTNFRMIMETNADRQYSSLMPLAALSGNNAFNYYDASGLYQKNSDGSVAPYADSLKMQEIRAVNRMISSDMEDLATKAQSYGLFVHNWQGSHSETTMAPYGISFSPSYPTSQGISIRRNGTQTVLMSTRGGAFSMPSQMVVKSASSGRFDKSGEWVESEKVPGSDNFFVRPGETVLITHDRLTDADEPKAVYQAETALVENGAQVKYDVSAIGFAGNGFVQMPSEEGASITFCNVDGFEGGTRTLKIRYSLEGDRPAQIIVRVNGNCHHVTLVPTGAPDLYVCLELLSEMMPRATNTVEIESESNYFRPNRQVVPAASGNIDEIQIF